MSEPVGRLNRRQLLQGAGALGLGLALVPASARAQKATVKLAFIGPLTGGTASNGLGGRNSFLLAVQERNADPKTKHHYETEILDDECKPTVAVQAALKASSDPAIVAGVTHYCSVTAIATVDTYHKAGMPAMVWGAVLPEITYSHEYVEITRVNGTMINQNTTRRTTGAPTRSGSPSSSRRRAARSSRRRARPRTRRTTRPSSRAPRRTAPRSSGTAGSRPTACA